MQDDLITLESMKEAGWYNQHLLKLISKYLQGDILEIGFGVGNFSDLLSNYGRVWAIDANHRYLTKVKGINKDITFGLGNIETGKYFFGKKRFDTLVMLNVLEHIKNDNQALKNCNQLLKPGGNLILLVPAHQFLFGEIDKSIGHFRRYEYYKLHKLLKINNFTVLNINKINLLGAVGWFIAGKIMKRKHVSSSNVRIFNIVAPLLLKMEKIIKPPVGISLLAVAQK